MRVFFCTEQGSRFGNWPTPRGRTAQTGHAGHKQELKGQAPRGSSFIDLARDACPCKPGL